MLSLLFPHTIYNKVFEKSEKNHYLFLTKYHSCINEGGRGKGG